MQAPWKKLENEKGYPFYFNEQTHQQQWDHPKFIDVKRAIEDCNHVKYSKYRVALKFRALQRILFMEEVSLQIISGVFDKHQLGTNESTLCLESCDLEAVLYDIYFATMKQSQINFDVDFAVELMQNFLYNIYDNERQVTIQVFAIKLILSLLSNCKLHELYHLICTMCADHNNCITRLRLQSLLSKLVDVFVFMHEDVSFGQHLINSTIENCFSDSPGLVGLSESNFISWLEEAPQLLSWIPILYRIKSCEMVVHNVKCSTCKVCPLMGLMYRCIKCSKYIQCQLCFLSGRVNSSHKLSHSMREYSTSHGPSTEFNFKFIKKLCGLIPCSINLNETDSSVLNTQCNSSNKNLLNSTNRSLFHETELSASPKTQLQLIISQLEFQNRELHRIVFGTYNENEIRKRLQEHKTEVTAQIHKLKILNEYLHADLQMPGQNPLVESTPIVGVVKSSKRSDLESILTPIKQPATSSEKSPNLKTSMFDSVDQDAQEIVPCSLDGISMWIKDQPNSFKSDPDTLIRTSPVSELHNDLDDALRKLQQILANNFTLDGDSLGTINNDHLKHAVSEVEGMLTSFIDNV